MDQRRSLEIIFERPKGLSISRAAKICTKIRTTKKQIAPLCGAVLLNDASKLLNWPGQTVAHK